MNEDDHLSETENGKMAKRMKWFLVALTFDWIVHLVLTPLPSSMSAFLEHWAVLLSLTLTYMEIKDVDWDKK